jgi:hypothetical protein
MNLTIGNVGGFLLILFCINASFVGLGLADESWATKTSVITSSPESLESDYYNNDLNVSEGETVSVGTEATTDSGIIEGIPYKEDAFNRSEKLWSLLKGLTIGWTAIILSIGLPTMINFILIGAIGLVEFLATIYVLLYVFSILRGGGGI